MPLPSPQLPVIKLHVTPFQRDVIQRVVAERTCNVESTHAAYGASRAQLEELFWDQLSHVVHEHFMKASDPWYFLDRLAFSLYPLASGLFATLAPKRDTASEAPVRIITVDLDPSLGPLSFAVHVQVSGNAALGFNRHWSQATEANS